MRAVVQRVKKARVEVSGETVGQIGIGLCVFIGVGARDDESSARALAEKIVGLRIFENEDRRMNLSVREVNGSVLFVSQFTLFGDCRKGRRPSFGDAMEPIRAEQLFGACVEVARSSGIEVQTGRFQTEMLVDLVNDGPVTILLDTEGSWSSASRK